MPEVTQQILLLPLQHWFGVSLLEPSIVLLGFEKVAVWTCFTVVIQKCPLTAIWHLSLSVWNVCRTPWFPFSWLYPCFRNAHFQLLPEESTDNLLVSKISCVSLHVMVWCGIELALSSAFSSAFPQCPQVLGMLVRNMCLLIPASLDEISCFS